MSESKQYKSLFKMCSALQKEVEELKSVISKLCETKMSCQHECSVNVVHEDEEEEELCANPNQEIFDRISTDMNSIIESIDAANDYTEKEVARLDIDLREIKQHVKELVVSKESVVPQLNALSEDSTAVHKCQANQKADEMASHIAIILTQTDYLKSSRDLHKQMLKNLQIEVDHISSVRARHQHNFSSHQFRGHRPRLCYNCRRPGHEARNCRKPNPRMQNAQSNHVQSVHEKLTPNFMPERVKVTHLSEKPKANVYTTPKSNIPFKTHMEKLLEKTDPVEEEKKRASSMAILVKNMAEREAKLRALDSH